MGANGATSPTQPAASPAGDVDAPAATGEARDFAEPEMSEPSDAALAAILDLDPYADVPQPTERVQRESDLEWYVVVPTSAVDAHRDGQLTLAQVRVLALLHVPAGTEDGTIGGVGWLAELVGVTEGTLRRWLADRGPLARWLRVTDAWKTSDPDSVENARVWRIKPTTEMQNGQSDGGQWARLPVHHIAVRRDGHPWRRCTISDTALLGALEIALVRDYTTGVCNARPGEMAKRWGVSEVTMHRALNAADTERLIYATHRSPGGRPGKRGINTAPSTRWRLVDHPPTGAKARRLCPITPPVAASPEPTRSHSPPVPVALPSSYRNSVGNPSGSPPEILSVAI